MACRNSSPASWTHTHTHTCFETHTRASKMETSKERWEERMSQDPAWRGRVSQGISVPSLCGQAVALLASPWFPPCHDPDWISRAQSVSEE